MLSASRDAPVTTSARTSGPDDSRRLATLRGAAARLGLEMQAIPKGRWRLCRSGLARDFADLPAVEAFLRATS